MDIQPIRNDDDLTRTLRRIDEIFDAEPGTPEDEELDVLTYLVEAYERKHYPIPKATPVEIIKFFMEQSNRTQSDLAELFGSRSRASEILNGKRRLTLEQIRLLHAKWHIPVGALIEELIES